MPNVMISEETYRTLKEIAASRQQPLDAFIAELAVEVSQTHRAAGPRLRPGTAEWLAEFDAWIASHPTRGQIADDSRDSIYGDERD